MVLPCSTMRLFECQELNFGTLFGLVQARATFDKACAFPEATRPPKGGREEGSFTAGGFRFIPIFQSSDVFWY